jgi:signal transduction histidine kinase
MRERAEMLGGTLEIKADPGNGTIVKAEVPVSGDSGK